VPKSELVLAETLMNGLGLGCSLNWAAAERWRWVQSEFFVD